MAAPQDSAAGPPIGERLGSWKEIAGYLKRRARTVQRWEKTEGLPVHRHVHESLATVYAYTAELDAWQANRARPVSADTATLPTPAHRQARLLGSIGLALALALVTSGSHSLHRTLPFQERDWVLLEGFENRTGEALFDGTLRAALERELSNSEFVNVAPRERVEDTLRLMRRPPDATLNAAQAREVCLRDGGIRALVTGRTEKLGSTYLVSAEVIDPARDLMLASDTETASGQDQIWPAVRKLSNWVRETLGETMERIDRSNRQLEKVTTPSLRALQLFTEADSAIRSEQWAVSAQFTRQALIEDPGFASAYIWLALALKNLGDPEWKKEAQRALDLSGTVTERERYFIVGSYELMMDHPDRAQPALEALVHRYPDHFSAYGNLENVYMRLERFEESAATAARLADARPNDPFANAKAASWNQIVDLPRARPYAQRVIDLGTFDGLRLKDQVNVRLFHAHDLWSQGDAKGALAELQRLYAHRKDWSDPEVARSVTFAIASFHLTLGRFRSSQDLFDSIARDKPIGRTLISFVQGDEEQARQNAALISAESLDHYLGFPGFLITRYGPPDAEKTMPAAVGPGPRGEIALKEGRFAEAAALLQQGFDVLYRNQMPAAQWVADGLVTALEQTGNSQKALEVLEATSATWLWTPPLSAGYEVFWLRNQARLSAYYHRLDRQAEARKIDDQLRRLLAVADPDHPILRQLNGQ